MSRIAKGLQKQQLQEMVEDLMTAAEDGDLQMVKEGLKALEFGLKTGDFMGMVKWAENYMR